MMDTEQKLRIIHMWTHKFDIVYVAHRGGYQAIYNIATYQNMMSRSSIFSSSKDVIDAVFSRIRYFIYRGVNLIELNGNMEDLYIPFR